MAASRATTTVLMNMKSLYGNAMSRQVYFGAFRLFGVSEFFKESKLGRSVVEAGVNAAQDFVDLSSGASTNLSLSFTRRAEASVHGGCLNTFRFG